MKENASADQDTILYRVNPAMFRNHPFYFLVCILLIPAFGIGLLLLLAWWFEALGTTLTVTNEQTTLRKGVFSKHTNDVYHENVRNIQVRQSFLQRIFNVGWIGISSAGQSGLEIEVSGVAGPHQIKELIDKYRE